MPVIPSRSWSDVKSQVQTGDLVLFSGSSQESQIIETLTGSIYSHVGMLVRNGDDIWIWQTGPDPITKDPKTGTMHGGAQLGVAEQTFAVMEGYGDAPSWRQLVLARDPSFDEAVAGAIGSFEGVPFPSMEAMFLHWAEGHLRIPDDSNTMFCAELVARTYQKVGLLSSSPPANDYAPKSFSDEVSPPLLGLDATFEPEVPLSFP